MNNWLKFILIIVVSAAFMFISILGSPCQPTIPGSCDSSQSIAWTNAVLLFFMLTYLELNFKRKDG